MRAAGSDLRSWPARGRLPGRTAGAGRRAPSDLEVDVGGHKTSRAVAILALGLAAGCSGIKPGRRPEATFEAIRKAMLARKYEALWGLLSAKSRDREVAGVRQEQRAIEDSINNMTPEQKQAFLGRYGISPERFMNMSPAEVFAMRMRNASRLAAGLGEALRAAEVKSARTEGNTATLEIAIGGEERVSLTLEREHGLYRVKSFDDLMEAFRTVERARRPGSTPEETIEAFRACLRDRAYEGIWKLFAPGLRDSVTRSAEKQKERLKGLSSSERRSFERKFGVTVDEYLELPPSGVLAVEVRYNLEVRHQAPSIMLGDYVSAELAGDRATILLKGRHGEFRIPMVLLREGGGEGRWFLESF